MVHCRYIMGVISHGRRCRVLIASADELVRIQLLVKQVWIDCMRESDGGRGHATGVCAQREGHQRLLPWLTRAERWFRVKCCQERQPSLMASDTMVHSRAATTLLPSGGLVVLLMRTMRGRISQMLAIWVPVSTTENTHGRGVRTASTKDPDRACALG